MKPENEKDSAELVEKLAKKYQKENDCLVEHLRTGDVIPEQVRNIIHAIWTDGYKAAQSNLPVDADVEKLYPIMTFESFMKTDHDNEDSYTLYEIKQKCKREGYKACQSNLPETVFVKVSVKDRLPDTGEEVIAKWGDHFYVVRYNDKYHFQIEDGSTIPYSNFSFWLEETAAPRYSEEQLKKAMYKAKDLTVANMQFSAQINGWSLSFKLDDDIQEYINSLQPKQQHGNNRPVRSN